MIFGVLKLKFDEDKACSLSSQILTFCLQLRAKQSKNPQKALKRQAAKALLMPNLSANSQGEVSRDGFKGFASLAVATASRSDVKI